MQNRRILITGGAGLIGSHIADLLAERDVREIVVLDNFVRGRRENLARAAASGRLTVVEGDIRDRKLLAEVMQGIDLVFHQAAIRITQCAEDPRLAPHYLIQLHRDGRLDRVTLRVEARPDAADEAAREASGRDLAHRVKAMIGLTIAVDVVPPGGVERSAGKAQRILDLRAKAPG